jgi:hypothetical protein
VRILFAALHNGYYRNLDTVVDELARRGHEIHLGAEREDSTFGGQPIVDRLTAAFTNITAGRMAARDPESLFLPAKIRLAIDYLRYFEPAYGPSSGLWVRARERTPRGMLRLSKSPLLRWRPIRRVVARALDAADRAVPEAPEIERFLDQQRPDVIVLTPLIGLVASSQIDLLRSAIRRSIPAAVMVWSWDHLSSKALIRDIPDALLVWNDVQKREAMTMHAVPEARIVVTGAQCCDRWFGRVPTRSRTEFVHHVGLADERPYVLWAGSALLPGTPPEPGIFMRWASQLRRSNNPLVRDVPILLRPHPARMADWASVDWRSVGTVAMFGGPPVDERARDDYFESLYYSAAVVGITTTAFLDAAVVGRPVMSFYADDLVPEQEASLHFQYLVDAKRGLLAMGDSLEEHARQLADVLAGPPADMLQRQQRFVHHFIRPRGMDVPATSVVADFLERLPDAPRATAAIAPSAFGRLALRRLQRLQHHPQWRHHLLDEREIDREARQLHRAQELEHIRAERKERERVFKELALERKREAKQLALARKRAEKERELRT